MNEWIRYRDIRKTGHVSDEKAAELIRAYHAATSYVDAQAGKVLDTLEDLSWALYRLKCPGMVSYPVQASPHRRRCRIGVAAAPN